MPEAPIHTVGHVTETLRPGIYQATLPNGKAVVVHLARNWIGKLPEPGQRLELELTPFDFDKARATRRVTDEPPREP